MYSRVFSVRLGQSGLSTGATTNSRHMYDAADADDDDDEGDYYG